VRWWCIFRFVPELTFSLASTEEDQSPQVAELENARRRFRSVLSLNILLSTIIRGDATLEWETDPPNDNQIEKPEYSLLKYVAAILVRDIDVIAAMAHKTKASLSSTDVSSTPAPYQVNVMRTDQRREPAPGTGQTDQGQALSSTVTAIANPTIPRGQTTDPYFCKIPPPVNCLVLSGKPSNLEVRKEELLARLAIE